MTPEILSTTLVPSEIPFCLIFTAPRSKKWKAVRIICERFFFVEKDDMFYAGFPLETRAMQGLYDVLLMTSGWKSQTCFVDGQATDSKRLFMIISCLKDALELEEPHKFCPWVYDMYSDFSNNEYKEKQKKEFVIPCRMLNGWLHFSDSSPLTFKEQFLNEAAKRGALLCPLFRRDAFSGPKISEKEGHSMVHTITVRVQPEPSMEEMRLEAATIRVHPETGTPARALPTPQKTPKSGAFGRTIKWILAFIFGLIALEGLGHALQAAPQDREKGLAQVVIYGVLSVAFALWARRKKTND